MRRKVISGAILVVAGLILFALVVYQSQDYGHGSYKIAATVTGKHVFRANSGDVYYIDFRYIDRAGAPHKVSASTSQSQYDSAKEGASIAAIVAANDPSDATLFDPAIEGRRLKGLAGRLIVFGGAGLALFIPGAWLLAANLRKRAQPGDSGIR